MGWFSCCTTAKPEDSERRRAARKRAIDAAVLYSSAIFRVA